MEHGDNLNFSTLFTRNCVRVELDECKKISAKLFPTLGVSDIDDIAMLEALRVYKKYLIARNKREGV
jgi:hypothetical protein